MLTTTFDTKLVYSNYLSGLNDKCNYAVFKSGQYITSWEQIAQNPTSTTSLNYTIQLPSLEVCINRYLLHTAEWVMKVPCAVTAVGQNYFTVENLGLRDFPLNQMVTILTGTLNGTNFTLQQGDALYALKKMIPSEVLQYYTSICPSQADAYCNYTDSIQANNGPFGAYANQSIDQNFASPRNSVAQILGISKNDAACPAYRFDSTISTDGTAPTYYIRIRSTEPVFASPFTFLPDYDLTPASFNQVQNCNVQFQLGNTFKCLSVQSPNVTVASIALQSMTSASLQLLYITPPKSMRLSPKISIPYMSFVSNPTSVPLRTPMAAYVATAAPPNATITSSSLQFSGVDDKYLIYVRKRLAFQTANDPDFSFPITNANIIFNSQSGLLSNMTSHQLWQMSVRNGLNMPYNVWRGVQNKYDPTVACAGLKQVGTCGGILVIAAEDLSLEDDVSAGCQGQYNWKIQLTIENYTPSIVDHVEIVVINMATGYWINNQGTSSSFLYPLQRQDVAAVSATNDDNQPYSTQEFNRMVGSGFFSTLKSGLSKLPGIAKHVLSVIPDPRAQAGSALLDSLGFGYSGGEKLRASGVSGGKRRMMDKMMEKK